MRMSKILCAAFLFSCVAYAAVPESSTVENSIKQALKEKGLSDQITKVLVESFPITSFSTRLANMISPDETIRIAIMMFKNKKKDEFRYNCSVVFTEKDFRVLNCSIFKNEIVPCFGDSFCDDTPLKSEPRTRKEMYLDHIPELFLKGKLVK